jgi:hypothetical protein
MIFSYGRANVINTLNKMQEKYILDKKLFRRTANITKHNYKVELILISINLSHK